MSNPSAKPVTFVPFDDATLATLDDAHGEIRVVRGEKPPAKRYDSSFVPEHPWEAVFRKPTTGESDNFEGAAHNDKAKAGALRNLAKATVVAVSLHGKHTVCTDRNDRASVAAVRAEWDNLRALYAGAHMAAQSDLMNLANMSSDDEGKG